MLAASEGPEAAEQQKILRCRRLGLTQAVRGLDHRVRGSVAVVVQRDVGAIRAKTVSLLHDVERAPLIQQHIGDHEGLETSAEPRRCAAHALGHSADLAVASAQQRDDPVRFTQFVGAQNHDFVTVGGHPSIIPASSDNGRVNEPLFVIPLWADLSAVALGGLQGALFASGFRGQRRLDLLGVAIIGIVMGMGGGLIRDLLLNVTLTTLQSNWYLITAVAAALLGMLLATILERVSWLIVGLDALVIGLFGAFGTSKALYLGLPEVPAIFVGVAAAVGGGILRDVLMGLPVAIMHVGSLYAVAAGAGCVVLTVSFSLGAPLTAAAIIAVAVTTVIRLLAVVFDISLPEQRALYRRKVAVETSAITVVGGTRAADNGDAGATG